MDGYIGNRPISEVAGIRREWVPTNGQTTFYVAYLPGYLDVFVNGSKLTNAEFTATNGAYFTLNSAVTDTDTVAAIAWAKGEMAPAGELLEAKAGRRNLLINGGFMIAARSETVSNSHAFFVDRWHGSTSVHLTGGTATVTRELYTWQIPGAITGYHAKIDASTATYGADEICDIFQTIEWPWRFQNKKLTVSFLAKAQTPASYGAAFWLVPDGDPAQQYPGQAFNVTTEWQRFEMTFDIPDMSGVSVWGSSPFLGFWIGSVLGSNDTGYGLDGLIDSMAGNVLEVAEVQIEIGDKATAFEYRSDAEELALCQRYYYVHSTHFDTYSTSNTIQRRSVFILPQTMRKAPTLTSGGESGFSSVSYTLTADSVRIIATSDDHGYVVPPLMFDAEL